MTLAKRNKGRRIVLFGSYAPSLINFRGPLISALVARGHEVFAMAPAMDSHTAAEIRALGATPVSISMARAKLNPLLLLRTFREVKLILEKILPDVVIAYTVFPIIVTGLINRLFGLNKFVPMITGLGYAFVDNWKFKRLASWVGSVFFLRIALAKAGIVIFQNHDDLSELKRLGVLTTDVPAAVVRGSGIDIDFYSVSEVPSGPAFLMIARLLKEKGVLEYGDAARRLRARFPEVTVSLAGWLDESPDSITSAQLEALKCNGIEFLGKLEDVRPALANCSVYVLPSSYREGTPRSLLEAMATGRPIITTDAPGCRDTVVHGQNGFLIPPRNGEALYQAMLRFIEDPACARTMGLESRRLAEELYDVRKVNADIIRHVGL